MVEDTITVTMPRSVATIIANKLRIERGELQRISNEWAEAKCDDDPGDLAWQYADKQAEDLDRLASACWDTAKTISDALHS